MKRLLLISGIVIILGLVVIVVGIFKAYPSTTYKMGISDIVYPADAINKIEIGMSKQDVDKALTVNGISVWTDKMGKNRQPTEWELYRAECWRVSQISAPPLGEVKYIGERTTICFDWGNRVGRIYTDMPDEA